MTQSSIAEWYKDDILIKTTTEFGTNQGYVDTIWIKNATPEDAGIYHVEITQLLLGIPLRIKLSNSAHLTVETGTGINEVESFDIIHYSNNTISIRTNEKFTANIFDISGRKITSFSNEAFKLNEAGIYVISVQMNQKSISRIIIIIE